MRHRVLKYSLAAAIVGCGGGSSSYMTPTTPSNPIATTSVAMLNIAFNPADIVVSAGTTVTWTNQDGINHNVTFAASSVGSTVSFSSGSKSLVMPMTPGTYAYHCTIHPASMNGTVKVQ